MHSALFFLQPSFQHLSSCEFSLELDSEIVKATSFFLFSSDWDSLIVMPILASLTLFSDLDLLTVTSNELSWKLSSD